ncbi:hypothetical protein MLD38_007049 [Melastoma candidum]|uniref:Uncharacterized protein n=1 Tax=Melastoma candidum TaxID=119954 RepID=A0ACB9RSV7_9MYRT|nr:hypothetical protein MLD38_007049 [Melastoma candidum]
MAKCARCCLHSTLRGVNMVVNLFGVGMVIYSLWLEKKWDDGVSSLTTTTDLPRPWFIYTCMGVGIAVCLSMVGGYIVSNCLSHSSLCIYIISLVSILFVEVAVLVMIFFRADWEKLITEYIDEEHEEFEDFVIFHYTMCRLIVITIAVLQVVVIAFAVILWVVGTAPRSLNRAPQPPTFRQSFLVTPISTTMIEESNQASCQDCGILCSNVWQENFVTYFKGIITARFQRVTNSDDG